MLDLDEIVSFTAVCNLRFRAVMERLNMLKAPETFMHPIVPSRHPLAEHCLYRLSRETWAENVNIVS
jgi:RimJ/RimL family protein N-acetyltransferase